LLKDSVFYLFPSPLQKLIFTVLQHAGKMNTGKKHFDLARRNGVAGIREVPKGGPGGLPLAHDFAMQSLVCYTFCDR
jgi:hypothetical protein